MYVSEVIELISREEFAKNMDGNMLKIMKFLAENRDKAFTDKEISEKLKIDLRTTFLTLVDLKLSGLILGKTVGSIYYYSVTEHVANSVHSGEFDLEELANMKLQPESDEDALRYIG